MEPFYLRTCLDSLSLNLRCNDLGGRRTQFWKGKDNFLSKVLPCLNLPPPKSVLKLLFSPESSHYLDRPLSTLPSVRAFLHREKTVKAFSRQASTRSRRHRIFQLWCRSPITGFGAAGNVTEIQQELYFTTVTIKWKFQLYNTIEKAYHSQCLCQPSSINLHTLGINRNNLHLGVPAHIHMLLSLGSLRNSTFKWHHHFRLSVWQPDGKRPFICRSQINSTQEERAQFTLSSISKTCHLPAPKWAQFCCSHPIDLPKERDLKSNIKTATKRIEKIVKMWNMIIDPKTGYHLATT